MNKMAHAWQVSPQEAVEIQNKLAKMIEIKPLDRPIRLIAGVDASFLNEDTCLAAVVLWDLKAQQVLEQHTAVHPVYFPYIPGFLSFREAPAILSVLAKLSRQPDLIMCDGHGIAHPRRLGIAAHIGVLTQSITIGCAKSKLVGYYEEPGQQRGDCSALIYRYERIGTVLRTKNKVKPLFVSLGHKIDLPSAERLVLDCFGGYRLPEPTRLADKLAAVAKKVILDQQIKTFDVHVLLRKQRNI